MADMMKFPETFDEFAEEYKIVDSKEVYTNGTELIPIFRVKQWLENLPTADVVEVGRCKDCKHWTGKKYVGCCRLSKIVARHADDFCSYGKRRKTNNEENRQ